MNNTCRTTSLATFRVLLLLAVFAAVLFAAVDVFACPTCKDGIAESDPTSQAQAKGYFYSILFMMAMPFVLIGTFGGAAYYSIRRARDQQIATAAGLAEERQPTSS